MNNKSYLAALEKALSGLAKTSRDDIVQEIQSHASESGDLLSERFGSPEELAKQYMEGEKVATPLDQKIWGMSKKLFIGIGMTVVGLVAIIALISWWWTRDAFDYANQNSAELDVNSGDWKSIDWQGNLDVEVAQGSAVLYWHDEMTLRTKCDGNKPIKMQGSMVRLGRAHCLVYMPKTPTTILVNQASLVLVQPQVSLDIGLNQSSLRIAEGGLKYQYNIDTTRNDVDYLNSNPDAEYTLTISGQESSITTYEY